MNILHLSDIHFGRNYNRYKLAEKYGEKFTDKGKILDELIECIKNIEVLKPEHIVVTGDIAWYGKKDEYDEAFIWFEKLLSAIGLRGNDITFCVGNHDVDRSLANHFENIDNTTVEEIDELYDYKNVHRMETPIFEFERFCERIGVEPFRYPNNGKMEYSYSIGYKDINFSSQNTVRLVAFNTALLSFMPNTSIADDKMWLGLKQVKSLMNYGIIPTDQKSYTIALFHHAERFLHPNEICEYDGRAATLNLLRKNVDLILCGHTETGGKPLLHQQLGGAKLLTGGAAYYSDNHPNAFSVICIADNKKEIMVSPYTFNKKWMEYKLESKDLILTKLYQLPPLGEIQEECIFAIETEDSKFEIPIKKLSVYQYYENGTPHIRLDNNKEVLRYLNIQYDGPQIGGMANVSVTLSTKMERSISGMLERERYFEFMNTVLESKQKAEVYIQSKSGVKIAVAFGLNGSIDRADQGIGYLEKLKQIEDFYGCRFYRPDELYENDANCIELLLELMEQGYTETLKIGNIAKINLADKTALTGVHKTAKNKNVFSLVYESEFYCNLFGATFSLGEILIVAGTYFVDKRDLRYKIRTFKEFDNRQLAFSANKDFKTYFILNRDKAKDKIQMKDSETFSVGKIGLKWEHIFEK